MGRRAVVAVVFALIPVACGGRTLDEPAPDLAQGADGAVPSQSQTKTGSSNPAFDGSLALPDCKPGFVQGDNPARTCVYRVDGRCYDTKVKACACACPRKTGTQCINGFPEDDGSTIVTCS